MATYASVLDVPEPIDMATVYVQPEVGLQLLAEFEQKEIAEIWVNPGAESDELLAEARRRKLNVIAACSIIAIGRNPVLLLMRGADMVTIRLRKNGPYVVEGDEVQVVDWNGVEYHD